MGRPSAFWAIAGLAGAGLACVCAATAGELPPGFVRVRDIAPDIIEDMRYATANNFTGRVVPGYDAGRCWLLKSAASALARASQAARREGYRLVVHDCYRPSRATAAFVAWAQGLSDTHTKATYYPGVSKDELFAQGYIGRYSAHSTGSAVDISMQREQGAPLDFGTPFDFFDPMSATAANVSAPARANRLKLKSFMEAAGFRNYAREWWHFGFPAPGAKAHDVPITD